MGLGSDMNAALLTAAIRHRSRWLRSENARKRFIATNNALANELAEQRVPQAQIEKAIRKRTASEGFKQTGETATA